MLKLLVVTPNPTVYDATVRIVQTTKFDAEVIQTTSRQVVEDVSKAMALSEAIENARTLYLDAAKRLFRAVRIGQKLHV